MMSKPRTPPRWAAAAFFPLAVLLSAGCGRAPPAPADPAKAREALQTALNAWKDGKEPNWLQEQTPPVHVVDHEWLGGYRLLRFKVEKDEPAGADLRCQVLLSLKDKRGNALQKRAVYSVGTSPVLTVVREESS
jgi:hypothetical protein